MSWRKAYLSTCIVLNDAAAASALGDAQEDTWRELAPGSDSKTARARRLADAIQSTVRDLERMERAWE
ncbi:hypothetical protein [Pendulispora albinea]|uniref:Uncharacterized protein n=1 Tax=Pendulispora albinea TaxID=2741071 RepID=A0ABZ2LUW4_9BACT